MVLKALAFLLLLCGSASAEWINAPIIGSGTRDDPYRPNNPDTFCSRTSKGPCTPWSALIPSDAKGVPVHANTYVYAPDDVDLAKVALKPQTRLLDKKTARSEITQRQPNIDYQNVEKLKSPSIIKGAVESIIRTVGWLLSPVIAWAASDTDAFTRIDNGDLGADWTVVPGCSAAQIVSNQVENTSQNVDTCEYKNDLSVGTSQYSQLAVISSGHGGTYLCTTARISEVALSLYAFCSTGDMTTSEVFKYVAGSYTQLATNSTAWATTDIAKIEVSGTAINGFRNGSLNITASDGDLASGRVGLSLFVVTGGPQAVIDDWAGGDITVAAGAKRRPLFIQ